ncbi:hypothetical protein TNCV_1453311 [Trichonephila clavipes]|nr:hypothetical protein TNCV_1453311 [Trichonephila clavipes]
MPRKVYGVPRFLRVTCNCHPVVRTTKDDRVSQEIAPHTVTPCEILCRSTINAGSENVCGGHQETESGFITEDDTSQVCHARGRQNPVDNDWNFGEMSGRRLSPWEGPRLVSDIRISVSAEYPTEFAQLTAALSEAFPVIQKRKDLESWEITHRLFLGRIVTIE